MARGLPPPSSAPLTFTWPLQPEKDGVRNVCYDICFKPGETASLPALAEPCTLPCTLWSTACVRVPAAAEADGSHLVAGVGNRVLVYDSVDGDLLHALKGHKVCNAYAPYMPLPTARPSCLCEAW